MRLAARLLLVFGVLVFAAGIGVHVYAEFGIAAHWPREREALFETARQLGRLRLLEVLLFAAGIMLAAFGCLLLSGITRRDRTSERDWPH